MRYFRSIPRFASSVIAAFLIMPGGIMLLRGAPPYDSTANDTHSLIDAQTLKCQEFMQGYHCRLRQVRDLQAFCALIAAEPTAYGKLAAVEIEVKGLMTEVKASWDSDQQKLMPKEAVAREDVGTFANGSIKVLGMEPPRQMIYRFKLGWSLRGEFASNCSPYLYRGGFAVCEKTAEFETGMLRNCSQTFLLPPAWKEEVLALLADSQSTLAAAGPLAKLIKAIEKPPSVEDVRTTSDRYSAGALFLLLLSSPGVDAKTLASGISANPPSGEVLMGMAMAARVRRDAGGMSRDDADHLLTRIQAEVDRIPGNAESAELSLYLDKLERGR